jgi:hypothetical protein
MAGLDVGGVRQVLCCDNCTRMSPIVQQIRGTKLALTNNNGPIVQQKLVHVTC